MLPSRAVSASGIRDEQTEVMVQGLDAGAWLVLLDDDGVLDRLVAVFANEHEARDFVAEVADQFDGSLEYGFYRHGWRFDAGSSRYAAP